MKSRHLYSLIAVLALALAPAFGAFVEIGDAGNAGDTLNLPGSLGRGSVDYTYSIGTTEVSFGEFNASPLTGGTTSWTNASDPITGITRVMAAQYCNWLTSGDTSIGAYTISGGAITGVTSHDENDIDMAALVSVYNTVYVLPTEDEWYKAAYYRGADLYSRYANGIDAAPSTSQSRYASAGSPWAVGSGPQIEQNGTKDMMGNVYEWLEEEGTVRGGSYNDVDTTYLRSSNLRSGIPDGEYAEIGMRIVAIPEPGTISLMSLSTISLFLTRTIRRRKQLGSSLMPIRRVRACDVFDARTQGEIMEEDLGLGLGDYVTALAVDIKGRVQEKYTALNVSFWNRMVEVHERRTLKRAAFRQAFKKRAVDGFDAFLALIIK
mgnify:CR=1 FL=1